MEESKNTKPPFVLGDSSEGENNPDSAFSSENKLPENDQDTDALIGESSTADVPNVDSESLKSPESSKESDLSDIPKSPNDVKNDVINGKKEPDDCGVKSTATTPSISGQDSGVSLISPDDSSCDAPANGVGIDSNNAFPHEGTSNENENQTLEVVDDAIKELPSAVDKGNEPSSVLETSGCNLSGECSNTGPNATSSDATVSEISSERSSVYYIKWILFNQSKVPIITQNENGPCPLLAIMNVLLLNGKVRLAPMMEMVTSEQLMTYLWDYILESRPQNLTELNQPNYEQNVQDAMVIMYKLQTGLDVNVKFSGVGDFEYTSECIIFDLLGIALYHGWLVDPQDLTTVQAIDQCSYNQLVESIIARKSSQKEDEERKGLIAEQFLDRTASQLTYHGLCELSSLVKENELCVFFRNNHFNTLYKYKNELFLLVTDQGYMTESNVVWETLSNVEGDGHFVDAQFRTYTKPLPPPVAIPDPDLPAGSPEQIDHDYQVALSLQVQEEDGQQTTPAAWPEDQEARVLADHEYALRLQEQEHQSAVSQQQELQQQQQQQQQFRQAGGSPGSGQASNRPVGGPGMSHHDAARRREDPRDKDSKCCIL